ncbi:hypothetical protein DPSP01_007112 [Paraphaeosphaeria sporulosa]
MELATLPPATARLAVELQLEDINYIMQDLDAGDAYAAFNAMEASLKSALLLLQDQTCAMDILRADHNDRVVFENLIQEERQAERDHRIARGMCDITAGGTERSTPGSGECFEGQDSWLGDDFQDLDARLGDARVDDPLVRVMTDTSATYRGHEVQLIQKVAGDPAASYAESSTRPLGKGKGRAKEGVLGDEHVTHTFCSACMEPYTRFDALELGCKREDDDTYHAYCRGCLVDLFETSFTDTTLFPPRCCGKYIPVSACVELLPLELVKRYKDKQLELASPNPYVKVATWKRVLFVKTPNTKGYVRTIQRSGCCWKWLVKSGGNDAPGVGPWWSCSQVVIICDVGALQNSAISAQSHGRPAHVRMRMGIVF